MFSKWFSKAPISSKRELHFVLGIHFSWHIVTEIIKQTKAWYTCKVSLGTTLSAAKPALGAA